MGGCGGGGTGAAAPPAPREPSGVTFRLLRFGTDGLWSSCVKVVAMYGVCPHVRYARALPLTGFKSVHSLSAIK